MLVLSLEKYCEGIRMLQLNHDFFRPPFKLAPRPRIPLHILFFQNYFVNMFLISMNRKMPSHIFLKASCFDEMLCFTIARRPIFRSETRYLQVLTLYGIRFTQHSKKVWQRFLFQILKFSVRK